MLLAGRLAGANLDGAVARARGVSRPWGFVVNELGDRAGDLLMFAGLAVLLGRLQGGAGLVLVLVAAVVATLPTFVSLAGAGAGAPRLNGGPFGKTERCLAVVVLAAAPGLSPLLLPVMIGLSLVTVGDAAARAAPGPRVNLVPDLEIHLRLLGWHLDLEGRAVWLLAVSVTILALAADPGVPLRQAGAAPPLDHVGADPARHRHPDVARSRARRRRSPRCSRCRRCASSPR